MIVSSLDYEPVVIKKRSVSSVMPEGKFSDPKDCKLCDEAKVDLRDFEFILKTPTSREDLDEYQKCIFDQHIQKFKAAIPKINKQYAKTEEKIKKIKELGKPDHEWIVKELLEQNENYLELRKEIQSSIEDESALSGMILGLKSPIEFSSMDVFEKQKKLTGVEELHKKLPDSLFNIREFSKGNPYSRLPLVAKPGVSPVNKQYLIGLVKKTSSKLDELESVINFLQQFPGNKAFDAEKDLKKNSVSVVKEEDNPEKYLLNHPKIFSKIIEHHDYIKTLLKGHNDLEQALERHLKESESLIGEHMKKHDLDVSKGLMRFNGKSLYLPKQARYLWEKFKSEKLMFLNRLELEAEMQEEERTLFSEMGSDLQKYLNRDCSSEAKKDPSLESDLKQNPENIALLLDNMEKARDLLLWDKLDEPTEMAILLDAAIFKISSKLFVDEELIASDLRKIGMTNKIEKDRAGFEGELEVFLNPSSIDLRYKHADHVGSQNKTNMCVAHSVASVFEQKKSSKDNVEKVDVQRLYLGMRMKAEGVEPLTEKTRETWISKFSKYPKHIKSRLLVDFDKGVNVDDYGLASFLGSGITPALKPGAKNKSTDLINYDKPESNTRFLVSPKNVKIADWKGFNVLNIKKMNEGEANVSLVFSKSYYSKGNEKLFRPSRSKEGHATHIVGLEKSGFSVNSLENEPMIMLRDSMCASKDKCSTSYHSLSQYNSLYPRHLLIKNVKKIKVKK